MGQWEIELRECFQGIPKIAARKQELETRLSEFVIHTLGENEAALLEEPLSKMEVFKSLSECNGDKALGMDGFFLWLFGSSLGIL